MNSNFFKKIYLFFVYRRNLLRSRVDLKIQFNIRVDNIYRFYTVVNIPQDIIEEPYNMRKSDIDVMSTKYIENFNVRLSSYLNSRGLTELYKIYDIEKVDKYSYLYVFGYSLFNTKAAMTNLFIFLLILLVISLILTPLFIIFN